MKCSSCGGDFASDQLRCPYCGTVNEHALKLAKELQTYDKDYEETRDELLNTGSTKVLKKVTIGLIVAFILVLVLIGGGLRLYSYRYGSNSGYQMTGSRGEKNAELLKKYMDNKDYVRAYLLASITDPSHEYFENYPEYKDELMAIYTYSQIFYEVETGMQDMDDGNNYRSFTPNLAISYSIFLSSPESAVKDELDAEICQYLKNFYQLTEDEIAEFKALATDPDNFFTSDQFSLEGNPDYETVTKERMVKYFGK